jgi:hypothetical protein
MTNPDGSEHKNGRGMAIILLICLLALAAYAIAYGYVRSSHTKPDRVNVAGVDRRLVVFNLEKPADKFCYYVFYPASIVDRMLTGSWYGYKIP